MLVHTNPIHLPNGIDLRVDGEVHRNCGNQAFLEFGEDGPPADFDVTEDNVKRLMRHDLMKLAKKAPQHTGYLWSVVMQRSMAGRFDDLLPMPVNNQHNEFVANDNDDENDDDNNNNNNNV